MRRLKNLWYRVTHQRKIIVSNDKELLKANRRLEKWGGGTIMLTEGKYGPIRLPSNTNLVGASHKKTFIK